MGRWAIPTALVALAAACGAGEDTAPAGAELAPGGTLRAAVTVGNPVLALRDPAGGDPRGVAVDVAREIARRFDLPVALVTYDSAAAMADAAESGAWDIGFLAADPARAEAITFTAPYLELEATYLVPSGSPIRDIGEVDTAGTRIGARPRSAYDLFLRRSLAQARLVYPEGGARDIDLLAAGDADVLAGLKDVLVADAAQLPGSRLLDGHFALMQQAIGVPAGRDAAAARLDAIVGELIASGLIARAIAATGARGARPVPLRSR